MSNFDDAFFEKSHARIENLRAHFPESVLEGFAREVVRRLATSPRLVEDIKDLDHPALEDIETLSQALVHEDQAVAANMMRQIQRKGVTLDVLYARYLAPASARLGERWDEDSLTFAQVSFGVGRIFELVNMLREVLPPTRITHAEPVLFANVPGENHGLGVEMAAELFRQHGWDVRLMIGGSHDQIMDEIGRIRCLVLGLSSGGRVSSAALARLTHAVRITYPETYIIVSGQVVTVEPNLIELIQPDSAVSTIEDALATMDALLDMENSRENSRENSFVAEQMRHQGNG